MMWPRKFASICKADYFGLENWGNSIAFPIFNNGNITFYKIQPRLFRKIRI